jgi:hypothetical protein
MKLLPNLVLALLGQTFAAGLPATVTAGLGSSDTITTATATIATIAISR